MGLQGGSVDLKLFICSALRCRTVRFYTTVPKVMIYVYECASCVTVKDPCADQNGGCMHECQVDDGKAHCDCKAGYILADDGKTCEGSFTSNSNNDFIVSVSGAQRKHCVEYENM